MSTYELDDDLVQGLIDNADLLPPRLLTGVMALKEQIPIQVPVKIGAVVQTDSPLCAPELSIFVRWASPIQSPKPWILREELDLTTYSTPEIGRIVEVLSEGVDL